jgi:hypothetical protein
MAYNTDVMVSKIVPQLCEKNADTIFCGGGLKMMGFLNGQERTITYLHDLLDRAGWKLIAVHHDTPTTIRFQKAIAIPN